MHYSVPVSWRSCSELEDFFATSIVTWILQWCFSHFCFITALTFLFSITTIATWHIRTANFWADVEQRIIDRAINEWQYDYGPVSMLKDSIRILVTFDTAHCSYRNTLFKRFNFSVHKFRNNAWLKIVIPLQLVHCCRNNCLLTLRFNLEYWTPIISEILFIFKKFFWSYVIIS